MDQQHSDTQDPISSFLGRVALGPAQSHEALTLWPLVSQGDASPSGIPYRTLSSALLEGELRVDEVSEGGTVPHVRVTNEGDLAVLFLFGEEIRGAKQNRVANASFLVPRKSEVVLDVSCVEAGRWQRRRGARFEATDAVLSHSLRCRMAQRVTTSRAAGRGFHADQGEVWRGISQRLAGSGVHSTTAAYADYRASRGPDLDALIAAFRPVDGQVGFVASIAGDVVGLEAIGRSDVFAADYRALLRSYAIDAIDAALVREGEKESGRHFESPETLLEALARTEWLRSRSLGAGEDLRVQGHELAGCALVQEDVVHMSVFPAVA